MSGAIINAFLAALNVWAYLVWNDPLNLAVAVLCAIFAVICAVWSA